jgi:hypothetical protein
MQRNGEFHFMKELCISGLLGAATIWGGVPAIVEAEELPREAVLPLSLAVKAASAALDQCVKDGYRVSVAVVDRAGTLRSFLRTDGADLIPSKAARKKPTRQRACGGLPAMLRI